MRPKTMVMLLVAIGCGVLAAVGSTFLGPRANQDNKVKILVAKADMNAMELVGTDPKAKFTEKEVDKGSVAPNAITQWDKLTNKVVIRRMTKDSPVTEQDISDKIGFNLLENERAVGINVNLEKTGGGFVVPGARVDVISVKKAGARSVVLTPFTNLEVLAVNQTTEQPQKVQTIVPATVTLKVTAAEAQKLTFYKETTTLSLALRSNKSTDTPLDPYLETDEEEEVEYLVARSDIDADTVLEDPQLHFGKKKGLLSKVPQGALHDYEIVRGKTLKNVISAGNVVTPKDFVVKKSDPPVKPAVVKNTAVPVKHFVTTVLNGSSPPIIVRHPEKPAGNNQPNAPPTPMEDGASDGKN